MLTHAIEQFAGMSTSSNVWDIEFLSDALEEYMTEINDFRTLAEVRKIDSFVQAYPVKWHSGIAATIVEGSEIPRARNTYTRKSINIGANAIGIEITDEERKMFPLESDLYLTEAEATARRLAEKEKLDTANVFLAGSGFSDTFATTDLIWEDIVDFKARMEDQEYTVEPDTIIMSPKKYNDLKKDPKFWSYHHTGEKGVIQSGKIPEYVDGLRIMKIKEVQDSVYLMDTDNSPLKIAQWGELETEPWRNYRDKRDVFDMKLYSQAYIDRPSQIWQMIIK